MGADVWKIEKPDRGDSIRYARGADPKIGSFNFWGLNRNKKSVGIDIKHPGRRRAGAKRWSPSADVVVENFRPGVMDRLGLGYDALQPINPRLVYCVDHRLRRERADGAEARAWTSSCRPPAA